MTTLLHVLYNNKNNFHSNNKIHSSSSPSLSTEAKFTKIKQLTDRLNNVVTRSGTDEFQQHYDYLLFLVAAIEKNEYKSIYTQPITPTPCINQEVTILKNKSFVIPTVKNRRGRPTGKKPFNCFSKTTSKLQMISKGITKKYKNKITSIKKKTTGSLIKIGVTKKNRKKNKR
jgi:hypothetical protein